MHTLQHSLQSEITPELSEAWMTVKSQFETSQTKAHAVLKMTTGMLPRSYAHDSPPPAAAVAVHDRRLRPRRRTVPLPARGRPTAVAAALPFQSHATSYPCHTCPAVEVHDAIKLSG